MTLYVLPGCPYCERVLATVRKLHLEPTLKDVSQEGVYDELEQRGGKRQEPFLIDEEHNVEMYEADDIIAYLEKTYGNGDNEQAS